MLRAIGKIVKFVVICYVAVFVLLLCMIAMTNLMLIGLE